MRTLERLGLENFAGLKEDLARHSIDCDFEEAGELAVAVAAHQVAGLHEEAELLREYGHDGRCPRAARSCGPRSPRRPTWPGSSIGPARPSSIPASSATAWRGRSRSLGVEVHEGTRVTSISDAGDVVGPGRPRPAR